MLYHPHAHLLVTAGGLSADATQWIEPKNRAFLVPVQALSVIFRAKMCAALKKAGLLDQVPRGVWKKNWVVHCQHTGSGQKVLDYLGRYVFRVAITNSRLERIDNGQVTFRYRDNRTQEMRRVTLPAVEFIRRFLQHVLPRGCAKVRYYGIWSGSCRKQLNQARALLNFPLSEAATAPVSIVSLSELPVPVRLPARCPYCKIGQLIPIELLYPQRKVPPMTTLRPPPFFCTILLTRACIVCHSFAWRTIFLRPSHRSPPYIISAILETSATPS
jgi:Putative transposase